MSAIPQGIGREKWIQTIPRVLVVDFVKTACMITFPINRWDHSVAGLVGYAYLGDMDVREHIIPIPHVKQVKVS
ncbi:hypothetical protein IFM89_003597 [Coptis chinensis]|uniref:Uncharacterized protein n=1 Tax=Coptis chinensis TaxID=261450 RepID=A0A835I0S8_9MAGN|nr:hypothetical protein IFM89_003597 [Coptis chinensis]